MFTKEIVESHYKAGHLDSTIQDDKDVFHICAPSHIYFTTHVVHILKTAYLPDEEIGGILWARPTSQSGLISYEINQVSFIRNAIADIPRTDGRTKRNAYSRDRDEYIREYKLCVAAGCLPLKFHTHPTKGTDTQDELMRTITNWDTSEQDVRSSALHEWCEGDTQLHLPRVLIVGRDSVPGNFFFGIYGGIVAPSSLKDSKNEVFQKKVHSIVDGLASIKINDAQKGLLIVSSIALLVMAIKYRRHSMPIIFALLAFAPAFLNDTDGIDDPPYYCKAHKSDATIFIPGLQVADT